MACACKKNSSAKQVTAVKQVVKKTTPSLSTTKPEKKVTARRILFKRPL